MMNKVMIAIILIFLGSVIADTELSCTKYECNAKSSHCQQKINNQDPAQGYYFILNSCPKGKICPFNPAEDNADCINKPQETIIQYPGGPCESADDCFLELKCIDKKCKGKAKGEQCETHSECDFGQGCLKDGDKTTCQSLKEEGTSCAEDYDCQRHLGCYKEKCTPYFSLENGTVVPADDGKREPLPITLCKSGYEYDGKCDSLDIINDKGECSGTCHYKKSNGDNVEISKNCECGFNKDGKLYCKILGGQIYDDFTKKAFEYLKSSPMCNTKERKQCNYYRKVKEDKPKIVQGFVNTQKKVEVAHKFINADKCALSVVEPEYEDEFEPVPPSVKKCPKYSCEAADKECAKSHFADGQALVKLDKSICPSDQICSVGDEPWKIFANSETDLTGKCKALTERLPLPQRFPGEHCDNDHKCFGEACKDGYCPGKKDTEECKADTDCVVGYYCKDDSTKKVCAAQKAEKESCTNSYQCQNHLVCLGNECTAGYFSKQVGTKLEEQDGFNLGLLCEYGMVDSKNYCTKVTLENQKDATSGLALCDVGTKCTYDFGGKYKVERDCECGYNDKGQGYCPNDHAKGNFILIFR
jgi:hypothetical protein